MSAGALDLAGHWLERGRPDRALDELSRVTGEEAVSARAFRIRALAHHLADEDAAAVDIARSGLAAHGPDTGLLGVLAQALADLGRTPEAERACLQGLALDPEDVWLLCTYARMCGFAGQHDKARLLLERAAAAEPGARPVAHTRAVLAIARGDHDEARRIAAGLLAADPDDAGAHALRGLAASHRGDTGAAYAGFRAAAANNPQNRHAVAAARELRAADHWLLRPLRPFRRFSAFQIWITVVVVHAALRLVGLGAAATPAALAWLAFCAYSWIAPPVVRGLMKRGVL
ncbi:tetratricopeptide repeat protein [Streptacidiphilus sp. ASG 303]|uniref:tetratricopeptide repeat protein n=1 Tax=Streptacidiphilus sp. ASG 303 TaxID=2896847 RepID=UPI001E5E8C57|nr:tetratricopeptide repeat protein [Streptacidiphilus sp. ASG 303]MCD0482513.1 tetratricopeptide repeat protein [Streptacidiphilus sp. ASG 303]